MTIWQKRRWLQAPVRKGVGSNPTAVAMSTTTTALPFACGKGHPRLLKGAIYLFINLDPCIEKPPQTFETVFLFISLSL